MRVYIGIFLLIIAMVVGVAVDAAEIEVRTTSQGQFITYVGPVETGDADRLDALMTETGINRVVLVSPGGIADEGYNLSYVLSKHEATALVPKGNICLSACATAFMGAKHYIIQGVLGFHVAWSQVDLATNDATRMGQYFGTQDTIHIISNGFSAQLAMIIAGFTTSEVFLVLNQEDFERFYVRNDVGVDSLENYLTDTGVTLEWVTDHLYDNERLSGLVMAQREEMQ
jgi:hypothetical protein